MNLKDVTNDLTPPEEINQPWDWFDEAMCHLRSFAAGMGFLALMIAVGMWTS